MGADAVTIVAEPSGLVLPPAAPVILDLVECVCDRLTAEGAGRPCWCGLLPGLEVSWDYCAECDNGTCGMGWVRLASVFPYNVFPIQSLEVGCALPLAWAVEVGALRCMPTSDGMLPDPSITAEAAAAQYADAYALYRALMCCNAPLVAAGIYTPTGPQGGCVGGFWTAWLSAD